MACLTSDIVDSFSDVVHDAVVSVFTATDGFWVEAVEAGTALALLVRLIRDAMDRQLAWRPAVAQIIVLTLALYLSGNYAVFDEWVYRPAIDIYQGFQSVILAGDFPGNVDAAHPTCTGFQAYAQAYQVFTGITNDSPYNISRYIIGIFYIIPFVINMVIYIVIGVYFRFLIELPVAFGPLAIAALLFPVTRQIGVRVFQFLVSPTISASFAAMVIRISAAAAEQAAPAPGEQPESATYLFSGPFLSGLLIAWVSIALLVFVPILGEKIGSGLGGQIGQIGRALRSAVGGVR